MGSYGCSWRNRRKTRLVSEHGSSTCEAGFPGNETLRAMLTLSTKSPMPSIMTGTGQKDRYVQSEARKERDVAAPVGGDDSHSCKAGSASHDAPRTMFLVTHNRLTMPSIVVDKGQKTCDATDPTTVADHGRGICKAALGNWP